MPAHCKIRPACKPWVFLPADFAACNRCDVRCAHVCRLQQEVSSREQLWSKNSEMDARLSKVVERNEHLMDELRAKEAAAATANGVDHHTCCAFSNTYICPQPSFAV